jgi:hypothetical protein
MFYLYLLITALPNLKVCLSTASIIGLIILVVSFVITYVENHYDIYADEADLKKFHRMIGDFKKWISLLLCTGLISALIPSAKDIAIIYSTNFALTNEQMKVLPPKMLNVLNKYLDDMLKDEPKGK